MTLTDEEISHLISVATKYRHHAFAYRSNHQIGACVLSTDGEYFGGCNTESVITGMGTCAERSAVDHAVAHGKYEYKAVAVLDDTQTFPCGCCLQYLFQFYQITEADITVIIADTTGAFQVRRLTELLPHGYLTHQHVEKLKSYRNQ